MITHKKISELKPGKYKADKGPKGAGRFLVRKTDNGSVVFYFRYTKDNGSRDTYHIGTYDVKGVNGLSLAEARHKAGGLSKLYQSGVKNIREYEEQIKKKLNAENQDVIKPIVESDADIERVSLRSLLAEYWSSLELAGKDSAKNVQGASNNHIINVHPDLSNRKASTLKGADFFPVFELIFDAKIPSMAIFIRKILHAAYELAKRANIDPSIPKNLRAFGIEFNPITNIPAMSEYAQVGDRVLNDIELAWYIAEVRKIEDSSIRAALLLCLLLGGQRMEQLLRVSAKDVDLIGSEAMDDKGKSWIVKTITILDKKGRRRKPRIHRVPIFGESEILIWDLIKKYSGSKTLFVNMNNLQVTPQMTKVEVKKISDKLLADGLITSGFSFQDLRRTCETMLAGLGVGKDIRAQIQSHGISGVQSLHYDRWDYLVAKQKALMKWNEKINKLRVKHVNLSSTPSR